MSDFLSQRPPWVVHPGFGPGDGFWRQTGEAWMAQVWEPFWAGLSAGQREAYHAHWRTPQEWRDFHFAGSDFQNWLDSVDDEDDPC